MISDSAVMREVRERLPRIARARRTTLISGPTGCGKEVIARELHGLSGPSQAPYVAVHCAALPENLVEAELFGHTRGAFTGASQARAGLIKSATAGTLFLDEIDSLSLAIQSKLLRFLESGEYRSIGSDRLEHTDAWVLAATNKNLDECVQHGEFRADLLYRLQVIKVEVPALRLRGEDIELLARYFVAQATPDAKEFLPAALRAMRLYHWPGNVRELKHRVEQAALLTENPLIGPSDLGLDGIIPPEEVVLQEAPLLEQLWRLVERDGLSLGEAIEHCERMLIHAALRSADNNRSRAADRLRIHVRTIFKKLSREEAP